ncbi:MAG: capsular biosynthesis protein [Cyanobium sp. CACIAM 14]|nr:MAG: capsular biosynthesis protein [Cyanobium sp. CACIAM 14]
MQSYFRKHRIRPENVPEWLIWWSMTLTYVIWAIGGLYVVGAFLGWLLLLCLLIKVLAQEPQMPEEQKVHLHWCLWIWIAGMLFMEVSLIIGHLDYDLGAGMLLKSSIGWAKGWAALALYPLAGCLKIRSQLIYRAACIVGLHTLLITPLLLVAPSLHLPQVLYISPLRAVGGPGNEFFDVPLYEIDTTGELRWRLFTPWGPALGFVGNVYFMLSLQEKSLAWKSAGLGGAIIMCLVCKSRLAQLCLLLIPLITFILASLRRPVTLISFGILSFLGGILMPTLTIFFDEWWSGFKSGRASSTRVRFALKRIAFYRWQTEAPIWGHGIVERGPHVVEGMPIGSHHTWAGLLFVKGLTGFVSLLVPMASTLVVLLAKASSSRNYKTAGVGLSITLILLMYTFGENLEVLIYLYWPGMVIMGLALQERVVEKSNSEEPSKEDPSSAIVAVTPP